MKNIIITFALFTSTLLFSCEKKNNLAETPIRLTETHQPAIATDETNGKIQVAILLDTSNSMDGLIEQAKSRLWNIVNTLTTLKFEGKTPEIEIALYEYGNDGLNKNTDYIRQVAPLTTDLDLISEKLFSLRTNGGSEYCGAVIQDASQKLTWNDGLQNMKLLYIAGNEPFNQGSINYKEAIADALKKNTTPLMDENTANMTIQQKLQEYMAKKNSAIKEEGKKFLAENKKQPGIVELPSGIQYKIITQGTGVKPTLEDTIKVHYQGTRLDGFEFDNSYKRGEPIEFQLNGLIEGWKQTVVLMPAGSKWKLFIPSDYAYGDRGAGADIPGGATLIFELELLDVKQVKK